MELAWTVNRMDDLKAAPGYVFDVMFGFAADSRDICHILWVFLLSHARNQQDAPIKCALITTMDYQHIDNHGG
jgi:hypothetical protein